MTSSVVTADRISQKTWLVFSQNHHCQARQLEFDILGDEPGCLGAQKPLRRDVD